MVVKYAYLWTHEHDRGLEEGSKDRPAAILLALSKQDGEISVLAVPITHTPPHSALDALEIPPETKRRLGWWPARPTYSAGPVPICGRFPRRATPVFTDFYRKTSTAWCAKPISRGFNKEPPPAGHASRVRISEAHAMLAFSGRCG
jgi:hypothetical protein